MWIPPGVWYDFFNGERYSGPHELVRKMPLDRLTVLVKAGSIVPMNPAGVHASGDARRMRVRVYPGSDSQYDLYDDAGEGLGYLKGDSSWQKLQYHEEPGKRVLRITPPVGEFQKADEPREWEVSFEQEQAERRIMLNGKALAHIDPGQHVNGAWYTPESRTWHVRASSTSKDRRQNIAIVVRER
jgi:alpha-D-xyloside xylohydrolase